MKRIPAVFLCLVFSSTAFSAPPRQNASTRESLLARLDSGGNAPPLFHSLTPLLLDYVETVISKEKLADLYAASQAADFLHRLEAVSGKDLIDLGTDMFSHYEAAAATVDPPAWASFTAGAFRVYYRPGSAAEKDRALISREIQAVTTSLFKALDLVELFNTAQSLLRSESAEAAGLIPVYLHASRRDPDAGKIKKDSQGSATLGATIVDTAGRLIFRVDILYINALWLAVLEHEISHAVILLSTFDTPALTAKPLQGEADLRRAFFAGFRKIPAFLQEGLGDWAFYYHGFQANWGLLPPPETIVAGLKAKGRLLPLKELLAGDIRYAAKNRKAYSLEAAAFIEHLLKTQDKDKVKRWLLTNETNAAGTFAGIFGISLETAENQWTALLKGAQ